MSGVSSAMAISVYLSTAKDEQTEVAQMVKSDKPLAATVSAFETAAPTLGSSSAILANYKALQVLTGAYNMTGQLGSTAILKDLLTESPDAKNSLVQQTANTDYLHFARATSARTTETVQFGAADTLSLSTGGASATSLTMQNTAWNGTAQTKASPGVSWSFVLDDGSASASIAASLTAAWTASGGTGSYAADAAGTISGPAGAPGIGTRTDSAGNTVYSLPIATASDGTVIKSADIVAVKVAAGTGASAAGAQLGALQGAITAAGFDATLSASGTLSILDPATAGVATLAHGFGVAIATATNRTVDPGGRLVLGDAGKTLTAGQVLTDGSVALGTVKSVDMFGTVTLAAPLQASIAPGDTISVATGLGLANVGTPATAAAGSDAGSKTIALGKAGIGLQPGQIITSGGVTIGTVGAASASGTVTLLAGLTNPVTQGDRLTILPAISGGVTPALSDAKNVAGIVSSYETNAYETQMGQQYAGMDDALYYARTMGGITSISALMSNQKLLSVVTTSLGMGSYFGALDYDQQVRILTAKVNLKTMTSPAGIKQTAIQYLIAKAGTQSTAPTGLAAMLAGQSPSQTDLFGLVNGVSQSSGGNSSSDPILSLFT